jgi:hypothetical protein
MPVRNSAVFITEAVSSAELGEDDEVVVVADHGATTLRRRS